MNSYYIEKTCADLDKYYNSCNCILGDIGSDKTKAHSKQYQSNCEHKM